MRLYFACSGVIGALGLALLTTSTACFDPAGDCHRTHLCGYPEGGGGSASMSTTSTSTAMGGGGSGGNGPNCDPTKGAIDGSCGVFVSSSMGKDTNSGSESLPFATIQHAVENANGKRIYACAEIFAEAVTVDAKVDMIGGLDCANGWAYIGSTKKTSVVAPADVVAAMIVKSTAGGSKLSDVHVETVKATMMGGSSIGVIVDGAQVDFEGCEIVAGDGADGAPGAAQQQVATPITANGSAGKDSNPVCTDSNGFIGGAGGKQTCGGIIVDGGRGGDGTPDVGGGAGNPGQPQPGTPPNDGLGGKAQDNTSAMPGHQGTDGLAGSMPGNGASGIGDVSASGFLASSAGVGKTSGSPGQGGGGGGGAKMCDATHAGPSGGGGGAGGCGGGPGNPGMSAGSSIGLVSLNATVSLSRTTITTGKGGDGGLGGNGQPGGNGGQPGAAGGGAARSGGNGGQGGRGSSGGGGGGGHSIAVAFKGGTAPAQMNVTLTPGASGLGAHGGDGDMSAMTKGDNGLACKSLDFGTGAGSCVK